MLDNELSLLQEAEAYVTDLLQTKLSKNIKFHTLQHTQEVVEASSKLADQFQLADEDRFPLTLAAWFHDTGYTGGQAKDHETVSIQLARDFMNSHNVPETVQVRVIGCIEATRMPQKPSNTLEGILCDADLFHLGTDNFKEKTRLLREELRDFGGVDYSKKDWWKSNVQFLENHKYFTTYGQEILQPVKEVHIAEIKSKMNNDIKPDKKMKDKKDKDKDKVTENSIPELQVLSDAKRKKEKEKESERGVSTVFRIMAQTQTNLSQMADSKANILISVNSIIISIIGTTMLTKLDTYPFLRWPVIITVIVCVSAIIFSILATRPNVTSGKFTKEDIELKKTNLLFFGNFHNMNLHDYDWAMTELLKDRDYLYGSIIKDTYFLGVVLARKYKYLRIAYNIFMFGLIIAIVAFALAFIIPQKEIYAAG
jgi:predicted metal-dependent HD superfamily phosphohydrolase